MDSVNMKCKYIVKYFFYILDNHSFDESLITIYNSQDNSMCE